MKTVHGWAYPDADEHMASQMTPAGEYQAAHLDQALTYVTDRSIAVDAGAHVGTVSRRLSPLFARVIAVEPSDDTWEALCVNMQTFGCVNVELHHAALGAAPGFVRMILDGRGLALQNTGARYVKAGGDIPVERIDDWRLPSLGFLKLDIEGSEPDALDGAKKTINRCRPVILFEDKKFWKRYGQRSNAPQVFLTALGYHHLTRVGQDEIWGPIA